ncbi:hypothetical protein CN597_29375 [Bacillus pseudomycoides]|nr:hypothetical protein CN597_29375 [Bacillus pseudomycoides]
MVLFILLIIVGVACFC